MKNLPLLLGTILGTLILVVGLGFMFSKAAEPKKLDAAIVYAQTTHKKGPDTAKVKIVEFSDYQCPGCKGYQPIVAELVKKYPEDVQVIHRHFPLVSIHQYAQRASEYAEAAATFGKFWEMNDMLFAAQEDWSVAQDLAEAEQKFADMVVKLEIDKTEFQKRIESQEVLDKVKNDIRDGERLGVNGTPTFIVNEQLIPAPQLVPTVESLVTANK